jgi:Fe2+ transport system protein FeoA
MATASKNNLYQSNRGDAFRISAVPNNGLLYNIGLRRGSSVRVLNRYGFGGPVLLRVENAFDVAVGKDIAKLIEVENER